MAAIDAADRINGRLGCRRPASARIVRLVHQAEAGDGCFIPEMLGQAPPQVGKGCVGDLRRANDVVLVARVVVHVEQDLQPALCGQFYRRVEARLLGLVQRLPQFRLQALPAQRQADDGEPLGLAVVELPRPGIGVVLADLARQLAELGAGEIHADPCRFRQRARRCGGRLALRRRSNQHPHDRHDQQLPRQSLSHHSVLPALNAAAPEETLTACACLCLCPWRPVGRRDPWWRAGADNPNPGSSSRPARRAVRVPRGRLPACR